MLETGSFRTAANNPNAASTSRCWGRGWLAQSARILAFGRKEFNKDAHRAFSSAHRKEQKRTGKNNIEQVRYKFVISRSSVRARLPALDLTCVPRGYYG